MFLLEIEHERGNSWLGKSEVSIINPYNIKDPFETYGEALDRKLSCPNNNCWRYAKIVYIENNNKYLYVYERDGEYIEKITGHQSYTLTNNLKNACLYSAELIKHYQDCIPPDFKIRKIKVSLELTE